jgi:mannose-1-phosphate guanylyltransferase
VNERRLWAIVLAGGEGSRLAETTRRLYGSQLPKQFLSFGQPRTFVQATVDRLHGLVPPKRTVVVVAACHVELARAQLAEFDGIEIVAQPCNAGTGPGVLLPLLHVLARDSRADVALVPSDHDFRFPAKMRQALATAHRAARVGAKMVLIGARARHAAPDLGWIVPKSGSRSTSVMSIESFVEKPDLDTAERLYERGALWNTMLSVARGETLWRLGRVHMPTQVALFESYVPLLGTTRAAEGLRGLYESLRPADFSRDLVAACKGLRVTAMDDAGWSDCGTPERLAAVLGEAPASRTISVAERAPSAEAVA